MRRLIPCGRCGVACDPRRLYCSNCGHLPWAHSGSCDCGTCAPLLRLAIDAKDLALAGSGPPRTAGGGKVATEGGAL